MDNNEFYTGEAFTAEEIIPAVKPKLAKSKKIKTKVIAGIPGKAVISVEGFGVEIKSSAKTGDEVTVKVTGKIGTPGFICEVVD